MGDYFKPWRRKFGVMTLVLACVFLGGWFRSRTTRDNFFISHPSALHAFASAGGTVRWGRQTPGFQDDDLFDYSSRPVLDQEDHDSYWRAEEAMEWRYGFGDFDFGAGSSMITGQRYRMERWAVPYWSMAIPLTLPSTWLLLSKPRLPISNSPAPTAQ